MKTGKLCAALLIPIALAAQTRVGPTDGGYLIASGWKVRPAGRQIPLSNLPLTLRLSADAQRLFILHSGNAAPTLQVLDGVTGDRLDSVSFKDAWLGLALSGGSQRVYAGGGATGAVHELSVNGGRLAPVRAIDVREASSAEGDFIGDVALSRDKRRLFAANLLAGTIAVVDLANGRKIASWRTGRLPYRVIESGEGDVLVTSWIDGELWRHAPTGELVQKIAIGPHASDIVLGAGRAYVAASNTNAVFVVDTTAASWKVAGRINVALTPRMPPGMTPSALALDSDRKTLYVVCSDANAVAVVDLSGEKPSVAGFIPTGWYPTAVAIKPDATLLVLNGKGVRSFPNPLGPQDNAPRRPERQVQRVERIQIGGLSIIPPVSPADLDRYTRTVIDNSPYRDELLSDAGVPAHNPVPARVGDASPIRHVIYIIKENRTYDQVLGDLGKGNGDPSLVLFGEESSPNHRKLAREFVLLDNFYVNSDVSADGHIWSAGAIAPDYTQKLWPGQYAGRTGQFSLYWGRPPRNFTEEASHPAGGYVWTRAFEAGLTVRNYGWFTKLLPMPGKDGSHVSAAQSRQLWENTNTRFRAYDLNYRDVDRVKVFLEDLAAFEKKGEMPRLVLMRLGNDHTQGMRAGAPAPKAMFADNDLALGRLVEGVSRSRFWKETAIFVLEDDAQSGPDHVDSHRSVAFVISPYTRRGAIDSSMYNTASMLRTIGLILGFPPMTHYDAGALPMWNCFGRRAVLTPYEAATPKQSLDERNPAGTPLAARSEKLDLREADLSDDEEFNEILWLGLKGAPPPAPVYSRFPLANALAPTSLRRPAVQ